MLKVLFLCTENACRSQMAEGLVNHDLAGQVKAWSAGVRPSRVNPRAIQVMAEIGIDISHHRSKSVDDLAGEAFDLVITVCDQAQQQCPIFPGETEVMHVGFPDPARATGTEERSWPPSGRCGTPCGSKWCRCSGRESWSPVIGP